MKPKLLLLWLMLLVGAVGAHAKEAYFSVVFIDPWLSEVTFYYDNNRAQRQNCHLVTNNGSPLFNSTVFSERQEEIDITFDSSFASYCPTNTSYWFSYTFTVSGFATFTGWENLNTSQVTNMSHMFDGLRVLAFKELDGYSFDLSHFDTRNVTDMSYMLCNMSSRASEGNYLDLSSFTFKNGITATKIVGAPVSSLILPATANNLASDAFSGIGSAEYPVELICPQNFTPSDATQHDGYFTWKGGNFSGTIPSSNNAKEAYYTVEYYDPYYEGDSQMYMWCTFTFYYDNLRSTRGETRSVTQNGQPLNFSFQHVERDVYIKFDSSFADFLPTNTSYWFYHLDVGNDMGLTFQDVQNLNTSEVTNMSHMFEGIVSDGLYTTGYEYSGIDVSHFDTRKVTDMSYMFANINSNVTFHLDLSSFTINANCNTEGMMSNSLNNYIDRLTIPATANNLADNACSGIGDSEYPAELIYPEGFILTGATPYNGYFTWKGGTFGTSLPSPYVVLEGSTLTFRYDNRRYQYTTTYDLNTGTNEPGWHANASSVTSVVFENDFGMVLPTSCYRWFHDMSNLTTITDIKYLKTNNVTNMQRMFAGCSKLTSLNVSGFDGFNTSNVTDMSYMFYNCYGLSSLNVSEFNTSKVTNMSYMFYNCHGLSSLNVSGFNTSNVTNMSYMFYNCYGLTSLNVSGFNTSKVTTMRHMFYDCSKLTSLDVSGFNTSKVTDMQYMFYECSKLTNLDVSGFNTAKVTNMQWMFNTCSKLESLDLSGFTFNSGTTTSQMLKYCSGLKHLYVPAAANNLNSDACASVGTKAAPCSLSYPVGFTPEKTSTGDDWYQWKSGYFKDAPQPYAVLSYDKTTLKFYCDSERTSRIGSTYNLNTGNNTPLWYNSRANVTTVEFDPSFADARPSTCFSWFPMTNLNSITGLEYLNTSAVTDMEQMFMGCPLENIDVSHFNTAKVTTMDGMFYECTNLKSIDLSKFDTNGMNDPYTGFISMFNSCTSLTSLDLSSFTFSTDANNMSMLSNCTSLQKLTIPATATELNANACTNVGTQSAPCTLIYPEGFTPEKTATGDGWYKWKSGYFKDAGPEPYAVLDGSTLTFYYDANYSTISGTVYDMNTSDTFPGWFYNNTSVEQVVFDSSFAAARPTTCYCWFANLFNLTTITGIEYLNTEEVTSMRSMFNGCSKLSSLDVSGFDTSKVTDISSMFCECSSLTSLDVSGFDTSSATDMLSMFQGCSSLTSLDLSSFDTSNVTDMQSMFRYCSSLTSLDLSTFDTSNVTYFICMFDDCSSLINLNVRGFNTEKATIIDYMFSDCSNLMNLDLSGFTFNSGISTFNMLENCSSLKTLAIPVSASTIDAGACTGVGTKAEPCALVYPDGFTPSITESGDGWYKWNSGYFKDAVPEPYAILNGTTLIFVYDKWRPIINDETFGMETGATEPQWLSKAEDIVTVVFDSSFADARPTSCFCWFSGMNKLTYITGIGNLNTDEVTTMYGMFNGCSSLKNLDVSGFNTSKVTNMQLMFASCSGLTSLDVSNFDTSEVTVMASMFDMCSGLTSLDVSGFDTSNVIHMESMFFGCSGLTSIDVSGFNTSNVYSMNYLFYMCTSLTSLNLMNFTFNINGTSSVAYYGLLGYCSGLKTLAIPSSATNLSADACTNVGTETAPCTLVYPDGFTPSTTESGDGWYKWKSGYFKDAVPEPYAIFNGTTLIFVYDKWRPIINDETFGMETGVLGYPKWLSRSGDVVTVVFDSSFAEFRPTSCARWFSNMTQATNIINLRYLNTSEVYNMIEMFNNCNKLTSLDVSSFNTANVQTMSGMFCGCSSLTSLDVSNFNTANVTTMEHMFHDCSSLTSLDVSNFNTANVTNMDNMFYSCSSLTNLNLRGSFTTANVSKMQQMFLNCSSLTSLDLSNFNTEKVVFMDQMFYRCSSLTSIDVSGFNTQRVIYMGNMFSYCSSLTSLDLSSFTIPLNNYWTTMMKNCTSLKILTVPATAGNLPEGACEGVGTETAPCILIYPSSFTPEKTSTGNGWYMWKSGYFKDGNLKGDANGDGNVSLIDVMQVVSYILDDVPEGFIFANAEMDGDNIISLTDLMMIVSIILEQPTASIPASARESAFDVMALTAKGSRCTLHLDNSEPCRGISFTVTLPEGGTMGNLSVPASRADGHHALFKAVAPGRYNVVVYANSGRPLRDGTSAMLRFDISGCHADDITVSDIQMVNSWNETVLLPATYGITTGIADIDDSDTNDGQLWYNTVGVGSSKPTRGVNIHNGKKTVVK